MIRNVVVSLAVGIVVGVIGTVWTRWCLATAARHQQDAERHRQASIEEIREALADIEASKVQQKGYTLQ